MSISTNKRIYALDKDDEISILVSVFDAQNEHYMDFKHVVHRFNSFRRISQEIQCRLLNKYDQDFVFMKMIYKDMILVLDDVPDDHDMKDYDIIMVYCKYLFQKPLIHDLL